MIAPYLAAIVLALATVYSAVVSFRQKPKEESARHRWLFPDRTNRPARIFFGIAMLILMIGLGVWFSTNGRNSAPRSFRFLIPEDYRGWVRVEFEIPGTPALPTERGQTVIKIPPSGILRTSSPEQYGWARDTYALYSSAGLRPIPDSGPARLIWGKINGEETGSSSKRTYEEFFVGSEQHYKDQIDQPKPKDSAGDPHSPAAIP
jgi:hypothetical protein